MADIFISYSKADRDKVVMLAAYLESEGWTVWWDTNLAVGDAYRDEIMKQLAIARAVIVLWTKNSITSDFVRAEAGQAKAQGKLIPVKEADVGYGDIPLPFGEMHTEELSKRELIRAAVVAQLARPQVQPSAVWLATRSLRYQVLTWVGIVGGGITLFANLRGVLDMADWTRWFVNNWLEWTAAFWRIALGWAGLRVPKEWTPLLSFTVFGLTTAFGARAFATSDEARNDALFGRQIAWCLFALLVGGGLSFWISYMMYEAIGNEIDMGWAGDIVLRVYFSAIALSIILASAAMLYQFRNALFTAILFQGMLLLFYSVMFKWYETIGSFDFRMGEKLSDLVLKTDFVEMSRSNSYTFALSLSIAIVLSTALVYFVPRIMIMICPLHALTKRLTFQTVGLALLIALNQLSHYAPDIRALLKPPA